ncbi:kunitz-type protease inhibitor 2 [Drosophila grimshawi]|uniref:GH14472 n=1 Tax=Drosophila grimshawi TaxID=7222 RepID=B4JV32_DROGR|nr:kunitz-type protease inhibitor 2 [Drosophila grimshawi]EDV91352.1 GH14472 [Drosophila grimshawi]
MNLKFNLTFLSLALVCLISVILLTHTVEIEAVGSGDAACKELNNVNCYVGRNEGNYCSSKDQTRTLTRWYYDKGACRPFTYKGCNGNRNRFCTQKSCESRCGDE